MNSLKNPPDFWALFTFKHIHVYQMYMVYLVNCKDCVKQINASHGATFT